MGAAHGLWTVQMENRGKSLACWHRFGRGPSSVLHEKRNSLGKTLDLGGCELEGG